MGSLQRPLDSIDISTNIHAMNAAPSTILLDEKDTGDTGCTGQPVLESIERHGRIPHVKERGQEADELHQHRYIDWLLIFLLWKPMTYCDSK